MNTNKALVDVLTPAFWDIYQITWMLHALDRLVLPIKRGVYITEPVCNPAPDHR